MNIGNMAISGLVASNIDIQGIITQLGQIRRRPVEVMKQEQTVQAARLTAYQQLTARCLSLCSSAATLKDGSAFGQVVASSGNDAAVAVSASAGAPAGSYSIVVDALAQSHKVASAAVSSASEELGMAGEIILNGKTISIGAADSLADIRDAINAAGDGASASILTASPTDHRLTIASLTSGAAGALEMIDANSSDILQALGIQSGPAEVLHVISDGAASNAIASRVEPVGQALGLAQAPAGTVQINGTDVAIDLATDSLQEIAARISAIDGVEATTEIISVDGQAAYRLEITGTEGQPTFTDANNVLVTLGVLGHDFANTVSAAQDAMFSIDGVAMSRSTNAVDDALENVQLQLRQGTAGEAVTIAVQRNDAATVAAVESFVAGYNSVIGFVNQHQQFDTETEQGGLFFGAHAVLSLESNLRSQVSGLVSTLGGELKLAAQVGLTFNSSDQLVFDSGTFTDALAANPEGLRRLFGERTDATSAFVEIASTTAATPDSGAAGWAVEITQPATQATAASAELPAGIAVDEVLTINGKSVALTAGMSLQDASELLNSLFSAQRMDVTASVDGNRLVLQHDLFGSAHSLTIASSLGSGAGGTELGADAAGDAQTFTGHDVAGTIGGEAATGSGRLLSAAEDSHARGLRLSVSATEAGSLGTVRVSKGIASRMTDFVEAITAPENGSLSRAMSGVTGEISAIDEKIADLEAEVDRYLTKLQSDFAVMETRMSQSLALLDWMEMQVQYLPGGKASSQ